MNRKRMNVNIFKCARCGRNHKKMLFAPLRRSDLYYGQCPSSYQPVLMKMFPLGDDNKDAINEFKRNPIG